MRTHSFWSRGAEDFIVGSSLLSLLGWSLALTQLLRPIPYAIGLAACAVLFLWVRRWLPDEAGDGRPQRGFRRELHRVRRRLRKPIFFVYAVILLAAIVGGSLYLPSNYDALSYRTPQLLHWLDHGGWHWIVTPNSRMNIASPGFNWLTAPLVIFARTDHLSFLPNVIAFGLLPGFLFEMFRRAGVRPRVAWWWMWILPAGYVFATQAGSAGNDLMGTVYAVAGIAFAFRARTSNRFQDLALSILAICLCTGIKNTNLPIILPWGVAVGSSWRLCAPRLLTATGFLVSAALSSCLPTTLLNVVYAGHWTGDPRDEHRVHQPNLWVGMVSNSVVLAVANSQPPLWPIAQRTNGQLANTLLHTRLGAFCQRSPRFDARWYEIPSEESSGLGFGVAALLGISIFFALTYLRLRNGTHLTLTPVGFAAGGAGIVAILVPVCLLSSEGLPRLISPFLPAAFLLVLGLAVNAHLVRNAIWRGAAILTAILPIPALLFSPARPLIPWRMLLMERFVPRPALARAEKVYSIYAARPDCFEPIKKLLPPKTKSIGLVAFGDEPETSLWRPFGSVSVRHVMRPADFSGFDAVVASDAVCRARFGLAAPEVAQSQKFIMRGDVELSLRASGGSETWFGFGVNE